jgi:hypothetical protein
MRNGARCFCSLVVATVLTAAQAVRGGADVDRTTPRAGLLVVIDAVKAENVEQMAANFRWPGDGEPDIQKAWAEFIIANHRLWAVSSKRFGPEAAVQVATFASGKSDGRPNLGKGDWEIDGDFAIPPKAKVKLPFMRRIESDWFATGGRGPLTKGAATTNAARLRLAAKHYDNLRTQLENGDFHTIEEVREAMKAYRDKPPDGGMTSLVHRYLERVNATPDAIAAIGKYDVSRALDGASASLRVAATLPVPVAA